MTVNLNQIIQKKKVKVKIILKIQVKIIPAL